MSAIFPSVDQSPEYEALTDTQGVSTSLREHEAFLVAIAYWDDDREAMVKRPVYPTTSKHDTCSWNEAVENMERLLAGGSHALDYFDPADIKGFGIGVQLGDTPHIGIDLDDVADPSGMGIEWLGKDASYICQQFGSWMEWSVSRSGAHVYPEGQLPDDASSMKFDLDEGHVELYARDRFFLLTGSRIGSKCVTNRTKQEQENINGLVEGLREMYGDDDGDEPESDPADGAGGACVPAETVAESVSSDPRAIRHTIERSAENGSYPAERCLDLWDGAGQSDNETDQEFLARLAYWCQNDSQMVRACFEASRRTWERHSGQNYNDWDDWLDCSMNNRKSGAVYTNRQTYDGDYVE